MMMDDERTTSTKDKINISRIMDLDGCHPFTGTENIADWCDSRRLKFSENKDGERPM
jgi:hypothetical protein